MKRATFIIAILVFAAGIGAFLTTRTPSSNESIKIGFVGPLTGDAAVIGIPNKAAVEFAVQEINRRGGINERTINLIVEDGKCDSKEATIVGKKLIEVDRVQFIVGGICSSETLAIAPLAEQARVILLSSGSSNPAISHSGDYIFRNYPSDAFQGIFAARYLLETMKKMTVSVIAANNDYAQGVKTEFEKEFQRLGGSILSSDNVDPEETNFQTILTRMKVDKPDAVYAATSVASQAVQLMKQAKQLGIETQFFGVESWDEKTLLAESQTTDGSVFAAIKTPEAPESLKQGIKSLCATCNIMPAVLQSYDAVYILADAIDKARFEPKRVKNELYETKYDGVSGHIEFDQNGDLKQTDYVIKKVENRTIRIIE